METLREYINREYGGSQVRFAKSLNVKRQQITPWLKKGFIVINHVLYSKRRILKDK